MCRKFFRHIPHWLELRASSKRDHFMATVSVLLDRSAEFSADLPRLVRPRLQRLRLPKRDAWLMAKVRWVRGQDRPNFRLMPPAVRSWRT